MHLRVQTYRVLDIQKKTNFKCCIVCRKTGLFRNSTQTLGVIACSLYYWSLTYKWLASINVSWILTPKIQYRCIAYLNDQFYLLISIIITKRSYAEYAFAWYENKYFVYCRCFKHGLNVVRKIRHFWANTSLFDITTPIRMKWKDLTDFFQYWLFSKKCNRYYKTFSNELPVIAETRYNVVQRWTNCLLQIKNIMKTYMSLIVSQAEKGKL